MWEKNDFSTRSCRMLTTLHNDKREISPLRLAPDLGVTIKN